ncbi:hypothetical protein PR048_018806 [Dryococelus australis]|uniref:Uncharacterized protein n=1 Tax=Dryococelus australis TaxID=614101 RepID=A0ABQ9H1U6_9NEOP|nr:hypothetical protein PR048_018806 [Dryococelus australis]
MIKSVSVPTFRRLPYTHTDNIGVGGVQKISFVEYAEQSSWLPCGIGGFICCVCFVYGGEPKEERKRILGSSNSSCKNS